MQSRMGRILLVVPIAVGLLAACEGHETRHAANQPGAGGSGVGEGGAGGGQGGIGGATGAGGAPGAGGAGGAGGEGGSGGAAGAGGEGGSGGRDHHDPVPCSGHVFACGDGVDNDGDGRVDSDDPECLGPCQNTESTFHGALPAPRAPCTVDCYFDSDGAMGNDGCTWDHRCDPHAVAPNFYPEQAAGAACAYDPSSPRLGGAMSCAEAESSQNPVCLDFCGPRTPNGCDCFGCCELPAGSGVFVWMGSENGAGEGTCDVSSAEDPSSCQPCQPVEACLNTCERCELCVGKPSLPADCGPRPDCQSGAESCGLPGLTPCPEGTYCVSGCCQAFD